MPSDAEIMAGIQGGEAWAAGALYDRLNELVVRTLQKLLRQRHGDALEDLVQSTFERMIRFLSQRRLEGSCNLRGWSRVVATNVALDHLRREVSERRLFVDGDESWEHLGKAAEQPESSLDARASLVRVKALLAAMQPKYAETVLLHDVLGHDLTEIADMMGVSVAATQSRLVRGRKDLLRRAARARKP
jgi:RNA polymerase sigma-70 factor (ECF subfamily)